MDAMTESSKPSAGPRNRVGRIRKPDYVRFRDRRVVGLRQWLSRGMAARIEELNQVFDKLYERYGTLDIDLGDIHAPTDASSGTDTDRGAVISKGRRRGCRLG